MIPSLSQICCKKLINIISEGKLNNVCFEFDKSLSNSVSSYVLDNIYKMNPDLYKKVTNILNISAIIIDMEFVEKDDFKLFSNQTVKKLVLKNLEPLKRLYADEIDPPNNVHDNLDSEFVCINDFAFPFQHMKISKSN
ncbi:FTH domain-containing protein [Caenorhabditis elegans]|uniref:FTH domain-containing protein n=1 Tax=Caenorhabditis elegans TaxID=6239 RepID=A0A2C9C334_CAEEL|nr:FTH domain-containing protein [Caenorhabditis elegans]SOF58762.1 FTH domain-containing protein [Caenorhabditis elegans]|eukprot:NP_001343770.1 Uncharacterized protein CELE_F54D5.24 [Caenorhabditis elegans]